MKKILMMILLLSLTMMLFACSKDNQVKQNEEENPEKTSGVSEVIKYAVTLDVDGKKEIIEVTEGEKVSKPLDPVKEGFVFVGWYLDEEEIAALYDFETAVTSDVTLVAKFEEVKVPTVDPTIEPTLDNREVKYVVTFDVDGERTAIEVLKGEKVSKPTTPVKDGFTFLGWYLEEEVINQGCIAPYDFNIIVENNIVLIAKFEEIKPEFITVSGPENATIGYSVQLVATIQPAQAKQSVEWISLTPNVLTIDENGVATPLKTGVGRIKAVSKIDEKIMSEIYKIIVLEECGLPPLPDLQGYKIVIMTAESALGELDPFLDNYTYPDKMYKQSAWREVEKYYNCIISVEAYPSTAIWGSKRIQYIIDNAENGTVSADLSVVSSNWLRQFVNAQTPVAVDVTDYYTKYGKNQMMTAFREAGTYKGKLYTASTGISQAQRYVDLGLYYNMAWVEKLGVKDPAQMFNDGEWNYTGFKNWCLEVQSKLDSENGEYAIGGHSYYWWFGMTNAAGVKVADTVNCQINIDSQRSKNASNLIYQLVQAGAVDTNQTWAENDGGFINGTTVMSTGYSWSIKYLYQWGEDVRRGYVPFPYPDDLHKDDTRISLSGLSVLMYNAGRESQYPVEMKTEDVYRVMTDLYLDTIYLQEKDPAFVPDEVVYESLSGRIDNEESIKAIMHFTAERVFFDPAHAMYSSVSDTVLKTPAINTMIKGNDYQQEFDSVKEEYEELFKSIYR